MEDLERKLKDLGAEGAKIFQDFSFQTAIIGVSSSGRVIYSYKKMVEWLEKEQNFSEEEAIEWIDYNTIGSITENGKDPIVMFDLE